MNSYAILVGVLLWGATCGGAFFYGRHVGNLACDSEKLGTASKVEAAEDKRDANVEAIGAAVTAGVAAALNENGSTTHESVERIRTVVVPGPCRDADPAIVRELQQASGDANATLRDGLRSAAARTASGDPRDAP